MSEPPRRRVAIPAEPEAPAGRGGCLRVAAILGVLAGIPAGLFGIPAAVDFFYGETELAHGEAWRGEGVTISVEAVRFGEEPPAWTVALRVRAEEAWTFEPEGVELELENGGRAAIDWPDGRAPPRLDAGADETIALTFPWYGGATEPGVLRLPDAGVRFRLTADEP